MDIAHYKLHHLNNHQVTEFIQTQNQDIIQNFDGYEYFLYYNSESKAWPKQNTKEPYILYFILQVHSLQKNG